MGRSQRAALAAVSILLLSVFLVPSGSAAPGYVVAAGEALRGPMDPQVFAANSEPVNVYIEADSATGRFTLALTWPTLGWTVTGARGCVASEAGGVDCETHINDIHIQFQLRPSGAFHMTQESADGPFRIVGTLSAVGY